MDAMIISVNSRWYLCRLVWVVLGFTCFAGSSVRKRSSLFVVPFGIRAEIAALLLKLCVSGRK